jgi:hypothetical protein
VSFDTREVDGDKLEEAAELLAEAGAEMDIKMDAPDEGTEEHWRFSTRHAERPGEWLRQLQRENHEWRKDAVPGAHPLAQAGHTSVEANELLDLMVKWDTYDRDLDEDHAKSEAGDIVVALLSFLSMMEWDAVECIMRAKGKNDGRDWGERAGGNR